MSTQKAEHSQKVVGDVKIENIIGGMRGLKAMLWEASVLDPNEASAPELFSPCAQTMCIGNTVPWFKYP